MKKRAFGLFFSEYVILKCGRNSNQGDNIRDDRKIKKTGQYEDG